MRGEEEKNPSSPENHTDGGGEPHKEVVYFSTKREGGASLTKMREVISNGPFAPKQKPMIMEAA
jgi:hypothetical protein